MICLDKINDNDLKKNIYCNNNCKNRIHKECYECLKEKKCLICKENFYHKTLFDFDSFSIKKETNKRCAFKCSFKCNNNCNIM